MVESDKIEFYRHHLDDKTIKAVEKVLRSLFLASGENVEEFENNFANFLKVPYTVGLNTCTQALMLALQGLGIKKKSEVITTPLTFLSTASSIIMAGAKPVFADVDPETGLLDPVSVESEINENTSAIVVVHLYGTMADMEQYQNLAQKYNLKLIEDAAHCVEGSRDNIQPGQLSDAACFSFYTTKNITCGEGGAIATKNKNLYKWLLMARNHGMNTAPSARYKEYKHWDMEILGYNAKMTNIQASMLISQFPGMETRLARRIEIARNYDLVVDSNPAIGRPQVPLECKSAYHLYTIWAKNGNRERFLTYFREKGIGVTVNYRCLSRLSYFNDHHYIKPQECPIADDIGDNTLSIPMYPGLQDQEIRRICDVLKTIR